MFYATEIDRRTPEVIIEIIEQSEHCQRERNRESLVKTNTFFNIYLFRNVKNIFFQINHHNLKKHNFFRAQIYIHARMFERKKKKVVLVAKIL